MELPRILLYVAAFVWGAIWGSFLNVCIYRLPLGLSVLRPPSHCPRCDNRLRPWHNVPIFSWLFLGGRCAFCRTRIPVRYPLVELVLAVLSVALMARALGHALDPTDAVAVLVPFAIHFLFVAALVVVTFIDIDHLLIPNEISISGTLVGIVAVALAGPLLGVTWWESLLGAFVGGFVIWGLIYGYFRLTGREGMGLGDFKLMAMVGAFLGIQSLPLVFFLSAVQGIIYAVALFLSGGGETHRRQLAVLDALEAEEEARAREAGADGDAPDGTSDAPAARDEAEVEEAAQPGEAPDEEPGGLRTMPIPFGPFIALAAIEWVFFGETITDWIAAWLS